MHIGTPAARDENRKYQMLTNSFIDKKLNKTRQCVRPKGLELSSIVLALLTLNSSETAARIVLKDDLFRAMTHQVQYIAIHCATRMKELNLCTNT